MVDRFVRLGLYSQPNGDDIQETRIWWKGSCRCRRRASFVANGFHAALARGVSESVEIKSFFLASPAAFQHTPTTLTLVVETHLWSFALLGI
jgi:hypothetical protein